MKANQPTNQHADNSARQQESHTPKNHATTQQPGQKREFQISQATKERVEALKAYIESI